MIADRSLNWRNISFVLASPVVSCAGVALYVRSQGVHLGDLICFSTMMLLTGLAITAGYHRYYTHRSYQCHAAVQWLYLLFGAAALQTSVLRWVADHRAHHRYVDQERDPYNIKKGFLWAHLGWTFYQTPASERLEHIPDLRDDAWLRLQHRLYLPLGIMVSVALPLLLGFAFDRPWGGFLWGGVVRIVVAHHGTFLVNSAGHSFGAQPYSTRNSSRDSTLIALLTLGEGYHNFHHTFPGDYRNGVRWYNWDPTKWWICLLAALGLAWDVNRTPVWSVQRRLAENGFARRSRQGVQR